MEDMVWIEDLVDLCRETLTTETLVFCKRQDEQAFAEKNGAQPKFVEDAVRMLGNAIGNMPGVGGFKLIVSHLESLHSHDAIAVMVSGDGFTKDAVLTSGNLLSDKTMAKTHHPTRRPRNVDL